MAGDFQYIFMAAVNEAIPLLDSQDVQIPLITEYTPVARRILSSADESTTLQADYVIHHYTDTISASDAAAQLETAVSSLTFQQSLQRLAGEYAISEAYNATSDTVLEITGAGSSEEDVKKKSGLSSGEIAAIVICGIVLLTFIFVGVCWISSCCCQSPPGEPFVIQFFLCSAYHVHVDYVVCLLRPRTHDIPTGMTVLREIS